MSTARFDRAVRREMRTIVKERAERPMNRTMDYGENWPPPATPKRPKLTLWQKALADVVIFALIWAGGAVAILIVQAAHH